MEKEKMQYFKEKLISERERVLDLINQMKENGVINFNIEVASEISLYDNHPSDTAAELFEKEKGLALKGNEMSIIKKIDDALKSIENHTYGKCKNCGKDIIEERLEFIPYAENCVSCQKSIGNNKPAEQNDRRVEEDATEANGFGGGGGNLVLKGGSHAEVVASTTVGSGSGVRGQINVTRDGGASVLRLNAIAIDTRCTIDFGEDDIASTTTANVNGVLRGSTSVNTATVGGTDWASGVHQRGRRRQLLH